MKNYYQKFFQLIRYSHNDLIVNKITKPHAQYIETDDLSDLIYEMNERLHKLEAENKVLLQSLQRRQENDRRAKINKN